MGDVVVIGAGIAGLSCADEILRRDPLGSLLVIEAQDRIGGNIRTSREEGFTFEWGVNGFLDSVPETLELVDRIGLTGELLPAGDSAGKRYIYREGRLREIPLHPLRFFGSGLLSLGGRLRILGEPFAAAGKEEDESVFSFAARRIGREAAEILVDSMVSGVYGGNARRLSLAATFPKMAEMEQEHGGLVRALMARRREARKHKRSGGGPAGPAGTLTSFRGGMEILTRSLGERLGRTRLRLGAPVREVVRRGAGYRITCDGQSGSIETERLVVAVPARAAAECLRALDPAIGEPLREIETASIAVVALGYRTADLAEEPRGFGFLAPRGQGLRILGCLWDSSVFAERAPAGWTLLRVMIGGAHDPEAVSLDGDALLAIALRDLRVSMKIEAEPSVVRVFRHPLGIPQYTIGHPARLRVIDARVAENPGLALVGNSYRGIAVNSCVKEAAELGDRWFPPRSPAGAAIM